MKILETGINGLFQVQLNRFIDNRGWFFKNYNTDLFGKENLEFDIEESYFSYSKKNVIRGMHFQIPPYDHVKLVSVVKGRILDVVVDLRKNSPTYKKYLAFELSEENNISLYIPKGLAHGFAVLSEDAITSYMVGKGYSKDHDDGIRFDSFGFEWPISNPILSERDNSFKSIDDYTTPF